MENKHTRKQQPRSLSGLVPGRVHFRFKRLIPQSLLPPNVGEESWTELQDHW